VAPVRPFVDAATAIINANFAAEQRDLRGAQRVAQSVDFGLPKQVPANPVAFAPERPLSGRVAQTQEAQIALRQRLELDRLQEEQRPAESASFQTPAPAWAGQHRVHQKALAEISKTERAFKMGERVRK
jgi:hypothetical protein